MTPAEFWGYDSPDANAQGRDAIQLLVDARLFAQSANNQLENVAEHAAQQVAAYRNPASAPVGWDAYRYWREAHAEAKLARETAQANSAKLDQILALLNA